MLAICSRVLTSEPLLMALVAEMPVKAAAEIVGEHDTRCWRILHHYVDRAREATSHAGVSTIGIDETSSRRGQDYVSLFVDLARPALTLQPSLAERICRCGPPDRARGPTRCSGRGPSTTQPRG
jgi:hypothetical protein